MMDQLSDDAMVDVGLEAKDVTEIPPTENGDEAEPEEELRADDFEAIVKKHFPADPDYEVEELAYHTWNVKNWRELDHKEHGPIFQCAGHPWRILLFPFGSQPGFVSLFLEHGFEDAVPEDWYACAQFLLVAWNAREPRIFTAQTAHHRFSGGEADWGFKRFVELKKAFNEPWTPFDAPLVEDDSANITAYVRVLKDPTGVLWHNLVSYDSKKVTGMVGLRNQGATCYLNSLLQSLYFTNAFRKAVYQIPTENEVDKQNSGYALQRLFYMLQTHTQAVPTNELTQAFGWDSKQIFQQQDVQELTRKLMERLEERMKGTDAENALAGMFAGKMKTYISCMNVDFESSREEDFWDVQLNVRGNKSLDESFADYIHVETMDGENKYFAEGHGLQDAKKGVIFESFPEVLHLQLKRFEYDIETFALMKVNDRHEFPEVWDAAPYLSENADRSESWVYHLHGVLVHSGELDAGHYYAFLKPKKDGDFYKFDDDRVTRALKREALEENFGGDATNQQGQRNPYTRTWSSKRSMNAYMLVYIRESRLDKVLITDEEAMEPPEHLERRNAEERAIMEKKRKEREDAHLYLQVQVASNENFRSHQGFDLVPLSGEDGDPALATSYRTLRADTIEQLSKTVAEDMQLDADMIRFWTMVKRQNGTIRPDRALIFPTMSVDQACRKYGNNMNVPFKLWLELATEKDEDGNPLWGDSKIDTTGALNNKAILLFLKEFDVAKQTLHGVGYFYAARHDKVADLSAPITNILEWDSGTDFELYEEIRHSRLDATNPESTLAAAEIQDGDILVVQKSIPQEQAAQIAKAGQFNDPKEFYKHLLNRMQITFYPSSTMREEDSFVLVLDKQMDYDRLAAKVGEHLKVDPTHLRFSTIAASTGRPKAPIRRNQFHNLQNIFVYQSYSLYGATYNQQQDALSYEILEMSLNELEAKKVVKVTWLSEGITKETQLEILVDKNGTIEDVVEGIRTKNNLSSESVPSIRVYETHAGKVHRKVEMDDAVGNLNEFFTLYAEIVPDEELDAAEGSRLISAFSFDKDPAKSHGTPFLFLIKDGELFKDTRERLSQRTGIKGKQLEKIKFALVPRSQFPKPEYLADDDVMSEKMATDDDFLGLDHLSKTKSIWNRADSIFIR